MGVEVLFPILGKCTAPIRAVQVDDWSSQFNRTFMFYLSLTFAVMISIRQMLGGSIIACDGFPNDRLAFAEDWCWSNGIYTIKEAYELQKTPSPYPGIIPEDLPACVEYDLKSGGKIECPKEHEVKPLTRIYQSWYPIVLFYFWCTSVLFFTPYKIYRILGFENVKRVVDMLQNPVEDGFEKRELIKRGSIWLYMQATVTFNQNSLYAFFAVKHYLALVALLIKVLFLVNVLCIYFLTHKFFKFGSFIEYGLLWEGSTPLGSVKSLIQEKLFPKVAACELKRYGPSGIEEDQGMCMLALNILNQYLFLIFWFCLVCTLVVNSVSLLLTLSKVLFPKLSLLQFLASSGLDRNPAHATISKIYLSCGSSLRFILDIWASNVEPKLFAEVLIQLYALLSEDLPSDIKRRSNTPSHGFPKLLKKRLLCREKVPRLIRSNGKKSDELGCKMRDKQAMPRITENQSPRNRMDHNIVKFDHDIQ